jgi:IS6 family transposase
MILSAIDAKLKQCAKGDFKGRHYEAALIVQASPGTCVTR